MVTKCHFLLPEKYGDNYTQLCCMINYCSSDFILKLPFFEHLLSSSRFGDYVQLPVLTLLLDN